MDILTLYLVSLYYLTTMELAINLSLVRKQLATFVVCSPRDGICNTYSFN